MTTVRKKQRTIRRAIVVRKIKLDRVSKPSQLDNAASGSGKMAINKKTIGSKSQAIELLVEMRFFFKEMIISANSEIAAIDISICILVIFTPSKT